MIKNESENSHAQYKEKKAFPPSKTHKRQEEKKQRRYDGTKKLLSALTLMSKLSTRN